MNAFKHDELFVLVLDKTEMHVLEAIQRTINTDAGPNEVANHFCLKLREFIFDNKIGPWYQCTELDGKHKIGANKVIVV